ncbi:MAG: metal-dependent hydrolase [Planctomycetota bacterium]
MDSLTQGLLGAVAAQAFCTKSLGKRAGLLGFTAGCLPDADVIIPLLADLDLPFKYHRHFSHALVSIPAVALLAALPFAAFRSFRRQRRALYWAALIGVATHGILDACTSFGTHLLWPFSLRREAWDCLPIVDPVFSLPLIVGWIWSARRKRAKPCLLAFAFVILYGLFGVWQHHRAEETLAELARHRGHTLEHHRLLPVPGSLVLWRGLYHDKGKIYGDNIRVPWIGEAGFQSFGSRPKFDRNRGFAKQPPSPEELDLLTRFETFSDRFLGVAPDHPDRLGDLRLSHHFNWDPYWGLTKPQDEITLPVWEAGYSSPSAEDFSELWERIFSGARYETL